MTNTENSIRNQTGYRVWVGAKSRWFRSLAPALASYQRCRAKHGDSVRIQDLKRKVFMDNTETEQDDERFTDADRPEETVADNHEALDRATDVERYR